MLNNGHTWFIRYISKVPGNNLMYFRQEGEEDEIENQTKLKPQENNDAFV